jgi:hypothetical protein
MGSTLTVSYSDVQGGAAGVYVVSDSTLKWGTGNITTNPLFLDADGPDGKVGTEDDNLRLSFGSPCIDAGDNTAVPAGVMTDLDGRLRYFDDPCTADSGNGTPRVVDMGAYEYGSCLAVRGDLEGNDCDVDFADYAIFTEAWLTKPGDAQWNPNCDISEPPDNYIDWRDAAILSDNWLTGTE